MLPSSLDYRLPISEQAWSLYQSSLSLGVLKMLVTFTVIKGSVLMDLNSYKNVYKV